MKTIFDVATSPPTSAEMKVFEQQNITNPWIERVWVIVMMSGGILALYSLFQTDSQKGIENALHSFGGVILGFCVFVAAWAYLLLRVWPIDEVKNLLKPLNPHECSELADVIGSAMAPEVLRYRDEVLAQNRDFCCGDARAIERYTVKYKAQRDLDMLRAKLYSPEQTQGDPKVSA